MEALLGLVGLGSMGIVLVAAVGASGYLARSLVQAILAEEPDNPTWLEALAPLKGRWLRLFLFTPVILFATAVTFLVVSLPLVYLAGLLLLLFGYNPAAGFLAYALLYAIGVRGYRRNAPETAITVGDRNRTLMAQGPSDTRNYKTVTTDDRPEL